MGKSVQIQAKNKTKTIFLRIFAPIHKIRRRGNTNMAVMRVVVITKSISARICSYERVFEVFRTLNLRIFAFIIQI